MGEGAKRFRKKPVEIEAIQWGGDNIDAVLDFVYADERWKEGIESETSLFGYDLGVEEGRAEGQAERDRLAQELEDALGHLRAVLDAWDAMAENYEMGPFFEAREFLARFPREGDEG